MCPYAGVFLKKFLFIYSIHPNIISNLVWTHTSLEFSSDISLSVIQIIYAGKRYYLKAFFLDYYLILSRNNGVEGFLSVLRRTKKFLNGCLVQRDFINCSIVKVLTL